MVDTQDKDGRVYELAVLFSPMLTEETLLASYGDLKALLEKHGASFISEETPKVLELAYEMSRIIDNKKTWFSSAYFGWVKFETEPAEIAPLEEILARNEQIIRFMTIKTTRENTMSSKKVHREYRKREGDKVEGAVPAPEINKEEVDKQIDALVAE